MERNINTLRWKKHIIKPSYRKRYRFVLLSTQQTNYEPHRKLSKVPISDLSKRSHSEREDKDTNEGGIYDCKCCETKVELVRTHCQRWRDKRSIGRLQRHSKDDITDQIGQELMRETQKEEEKDRKMLYITKTLPS